MLTKKEYEKARERLDAGQGSDDDRRLVKLYESEVRTEADPEPSVAVGFTAVAEGEVVKPTAAKKAQGRTAR